MEQNMCQFESSPKEIEYSSEDKVKNLCLHFEMFYVYILFLNSYHT
jgi:hypothetical protein